ncbi:MAG: J domain-containing protein [Lachnospiraceae bacterium]
MTQTQEKINPYQVLGLPDFAPMEEVNRRYRALAKKYHPDINPGHEAEMKAVNNAYDLIKGGWIPPKEPPQQTARQPRQQEPRQTQRQQEPRQTQRQQTQRQQTQQQRTQRQQTQQQRTQQQTDPRDILIMVNMHIDRRKVKKLERKWHCSDEDFVKMFQRFVDLRCFSFLRPSSGRANDFSRIAQDYWSGCAEAEMTQKDPVTKERGITTGFQIYLTDVMRLVFGAFANQVLPQGYSMEDFVSYVRAQIGEWIYEFAHERI